MKSFKICSACMWFFSKFLFDLSIGNWMCLCFLNAYHILFIEQKWFNYLLWWTYYYLMLIGNFIIFFFKENLAHGIFTTKWLKSFPSFAFLHRMRDVAENNPSKKATDSTISTNCSYWKYHTLIAKSNEKW